MRFIDLFAGLGGFHVALHKLGWDCVFASEINKKLQETYHKNFNITPRGDISKINISDIPPHDILCAGFPCQPFSKAGERKEAADDRGRLLDYVENILKEHCPRFFILENVPRFKNTELYKKFKTTLENIYDVDYTIASPDMIGVPQHRPRIFIVGQNRSFLVKDLKYLQWAITPNSFILPTRLPNIEYVNGKKEQILHLWQKIINALPSEEKIYSPLWTPEYKANYPFLDKTPSSLSEDQLNKYSGAFGISLSGHDKQIQLQLLPKYARSEGEQFPPWKINFIKKNREFCAKYQNIIGAFVTQLCKLSLSHQKLEWNSVSNRRNLTDHIIQFRPSGIRVSNKQRFPSLVSINLTQVPIVSDDGEKFRYLTTHEALFLQSFPQNFTLPSDHSDAFHALGNAVNTELVYQIASYLVK